MSAPFGRLYLIRAGRRITTHLEELAEHTQVELDWIECHHVSLMTNIEHAQSITDSIVDRIKQAPPN